MTAAGGRVPRGPIVVVGDTLLDRDLEGRVERVTPDAPAVVVDDPVETVRPGGAGLAAALLAGDGLDVVLVTALGRDDGATALRELLQSRGVDVCSLALDGPTCQKVRVRAAGSSLVRLDYSGVPGRIGAVTGAARAAFWFASAVLVSDYGRGMAAHPGLRDLLEKVSARAPVVWDPHPKGPGPMEGVRLFTPNRAEAERLTPDIEGWTLAAVSARARTLAERFRARAVAVTLGARGALLVTGAAPPLVVPAPPVAVGDPCGAGDRFASTAVRVLAEGGLPSEAVTAAVTSASAFVAAGGASRALAPTPSREPSRVAQGLEQARGLAERTRAEGGTVVATSGCFDLLHAGHISTLRSARALGHCLIVCLNSDRSVRRLKGPGRPLTGETDRAAVLAAIEAVDAVVVFDEATPQRVLEELRPDVFAKGADYAIEDLPEARTLARWGGQAVVLPYVEGRSTTRLVGEVARRAGP